MKKIILLISFCMLFGCEVISTDDSTQTKETSPVEVIDVIDGDTIKVKYNGKVETIRYLLIDTPELHHQTLGKQPYGEEAKSRNKQLLESGDVTIEFDAGDRLDDYNRMLAYIYVDGVNVQETLLEEGLARVAYVFPPNTKYIDVFEQAEERGKNEKLGVWQTPGYVTNRGFNTAVINNQTVPTETNGKCLIKGNINRQGKKIYHIPTGKHYEETKPEEWFCSEEDAVKAGFKKSGE
ncbi:thermonuclease family protein [Psychrobacillus lasiicapitis]|uniref:Thermonuclease family protein n=2 Tax=Psychrobacillus lasiicapitis TaxID=1636719 RepID=A0A544TEH8_9BACI|nr:thermonuclease family protein [Psychrobacillus lasiicapitis]TQR15819.1 thermonuclease family protein [Psychrobacillus lasiicapitis]